MKSVRLTGYLAVLALWLPAQSMISVKSGQVSFTEGKAFIDDHAVEISPTHFADVKENSVVRTEAGRAEVLMGPCAVMWMGDDTSFRMISSRLIDTRIEVLTGSAMVQTGGMSNSNKLTLVVKDADIVLDRQGLFRFDMAAPPAVKTLAGKAYVERSGQEILLAAGRMLAFDGAAEVRKIEKVKPDLLEDWTRRRAASLTTASDFARQQTKRDQFLNAAAAHAESQVDIAPGISRIGVGKQNPAPSPPPSGATPRGRSGLGMCGGW